MEESEGGAEVDSLHAISLILNSGLDKKSVKILIELIERGVDPESLAEGESFCRPQIYLIHAFIQL